MKTSLLNPSGVKGNTFAVTVQWTTRNRDGSNPDVSPSTINTETKSGEGTGETV